MISGWVQRFAHQLFHQFQLLGTCQKQATTDPISSILTYWYWLPSVTVQIFPSYRGVISSNWPLGNTWTLGQKSWRDWIKNKLDTYLLGKSQSSLQRLHDNNARCLKSLRMLPDFPGLKLHKHIVCYKASKNKIDYTDWDNEIFSLPFSHFSLNPPKPKLFQYENPNSRSVLPFCN